MSVPASPDTPAPPPATGNPTALSQGLNTDMGIGPLMKMRLDAGQKQQQDINKLGTLTAQRDTAATAGNAAVASATSDEAHGYTDALNKQLADNPLPTYIPTKDTVQDIASTFGLIQVLGVILGSAGGGQQSALRAMNAMTGMLDGYQQGRADLYERNRKDFEESMKDVQAKREQLIDAYNRNMELLPIDAAKANTQMSLDLAKYAGPVTQQAFKVQGWSALTSTMDALMKGAETEDNINYHREDLALKRSQGALGVRPSAISIRFTDNMLRGGGEILRTLQLVNDIGVTTSRGAFGAVVTGGTISGGATAALANKMTTDDEKLYNTNASGLGLELANVLGGGYRVNKGFIDKLEDAILVKPGDSYLVAAYKYSSVLAKLKVGLQENTYYTPDQAARAKALIDQISTYPTPEQILNKLGSQRVTSEQVKQLAKENGKSFQANKDALQKQGFVVIDQMPELTASDIDTSTQPQ